MKLARLSSTTVEIVVGCALIGEGQDFRERSRGFLGLEFRVQFWRSNTDFGENYCERKSYFFLARLLTAGLVLTSALEGGRT